MPTSSQFIVSPEEVNFILKDTWAEWGYTSKELRQFDELFRVAMLSASKRSHTFNTMACKAIFDDDSSFFAISSLWDLPDQISGRIVGTLPLVSEDLVNNDQVKSDIARIIAGDIRALVSPAIFDFSRQHKKKHLISVGAFFYAYPLLAKRVIHLVSCLIEYFVEVFERFNNDCKEIELTFEEPYQYLSSITMLPSEPHNGQKRSLLLEFADSHKLVYKPRSLAGESYLTNILDNLKSTNVGLPSPQILDQGTYGWMKWVKAATNGPNGEEVAIQIGSLLALASTIALVDLYAENVILSEEGIVVIDAETIGLLSPDMNRQVPSLTPPNVLEIGILPQATGVSLSKWWDVTLCGITPERQTVPAKLDYIDLNNVRHPTIVYHQIAIEPASIKSAISSLDIDRVITLITQGFDQTRSTLSRLKPLPPASDVRSHFRYIHRPTAAYLRTLLRMTDPTCGASASALVREVAPYTKELLDQLSAHSVSLTTPIVTEELAALIHGDVPRLTANHLDRSFPKASQTYVWSVPSRNVSVRLIEMSLRLRFDRIESTFGPAAESVKAPSRAIDDNLVCIKEITNIVKSNFTIALDPDGITYVLGVVPHHHSSIPEITKLGTSLYDGVVGILFIIGLASVMMCNEDDYDDVVQPLLDVLKYEFENAQRPSSLASGPVSILYVASFLYRVSKPGSTLSRFWAKQLQVFVDYLEKGKLGIPMDCADVLTGLSGWLLILDSLPSEIVGSKIRRLQEHLVRQILDLQQETGAWPSLGKLKMCGFSHGAAGVRYTLGRVLVRGLGSEHAILKAMDSATEFENNSFQPALSNWQDYRFNETNPKRYSNFSAWCHGAAGIALAEVGLMRIGLSIISERINAVFRMTEPFSPTRHSLCCGAAAYLELLRLLKKNTQQEFRMNHNFEAVENLEERDTQLALFKAGYGSKLLGAITSHFLDLPSLLLLE